MRHYTYSLGLLAILVAVTGCGSPQAILKDQLPDAEAPAVVELRQTPFFPQTKYHCGPAALAMVLAATGVKVTPEELVEQVYLPKRRGSLQAEMLASARRHIRIAYVLEQNLSALVSEVLGGRPVLVLLNLAIDVLPVWHYAVVVGFDVKSDTMLLHSGRQASRVMSAKQFLRSWSNAGSWAVVILEPGETPVADNPQRYVKAVAGLEKAGQPEAARASYAAALRRWPEYPIALFGIGNTEYALGRLEAAERAYLRLLRNDPTYIPGWNNLATLLSEQDCAASALRSIDQAFRWSAQNSSFRDMLELTRREIVVRARTADSANADECSSRLPRDMFSD